MARDEETYVTGMEISPSSPSKKREKSIINKGVELLRDTFFPHQQIRIISIIGLAQNEIDLLRQHLQNVQLSGNIQGKLTFEFTIENGRLKNIFVKEKESTIEDIDTINLIKKSLVNWRSSTVKITNVTLTLEIKNS
jgi:Ca-activated chloride channel homolog